MNARAESLDHRRPTVVRIEREPWSDGAVTGFVEEVAAMGGVSRVRVAVLDGSGHIVSAEGLPDEGQLMKASAPAAGPEVFSDRSRGDTVSRPKTVHATALGDSLLESLDRLLP